MPAPPAFLEDEETAFDPARMVDPDWDAIDWLFVDGSRQFSGDGEAG
ncbi:hypothetical protein [Altererythrobacter sp. MF3-039]